MAARRWCAELSTEPTQVALVTGAARGIGLATLEALGAAGYSTVAVDIDPTVLDVAARLGALAVRADVGDEAAVVAAVRTAVQERGRLDLVVNNAGVARHGPIESLESADLDRMWRVNVRGVVLLCREAFRVMPPTGGGTIINVVSSAGLRGEPGESVYCATKFAVRGLTEALAEEGRLVSIRVAAVYPAGVDTGFWDTAVRGGFPGDAAGSFLQAEDVAREVVGIATRPAHVHLEAVAMRSIRDTDTERTRMKLARFGR